MSSQQQNSSKQQRPASSAVASAPAAAAAQPNTEEMTEELQQRLSRPGLDPQQQLLFWALEHADSNALHQAATQKEGAVFNNMTPEELAERRKWLETAMREGVEVETSDGTVRTLKVKNFVDTMKKSIETLQKSDLDFHDALGALLELEDSCEAKVDFANDFEKLGGIALLFEMLFHPERSGERFSKLSEEQRIDLELQALNVLIAATQGNAYVQDRTLQLTEQSGQIIEHIVSKVLGIGNRAAQDETSAKRSRELCKKYLAWLSALLANNTRAVDLLLQRYQQGLDALVNLLQDAQSSDEVRDRILFLLFNMFIIEADRNSTALLRVLVQRKHFHRVVFDLLQQAISSDKPILIEKCLQLINELLLDPSREPFKGLLAAMKQEQLPQRSGMTALREKLNKQQKVDSKYVDIKEMLQALPL